MRGRRDTLKNLVPAGEFMHMMDKYVVARALGNSVPRIGAPLFDSKGKKVGFVADVIGPVRAPMIVIKGSKLPKYFAAAKDLVSRKGG